MTRTPGLTSALLLILLFPGDPRGASGPGVPRERPKEQEERLQGEALERTIEELATLLQEQYVFADRGALLAEKLRQQLWAGAYEGIDLTTLAGRLTVDLQSVNGDKHLNVRVADPGRPAAEDEDPAELERQRAAQLRRENHGFRRVEILEDNIGYLDLRRFAPAGLAGETAVAAMAFLANTDALIIDLRRNGGGDPTMIQLLCSYFFAEPTLLNTFQWRGQERIDQFWTLPHVPGARRVETPLYLLTSSFTFSAAEEFTYDLKLLGRATVVGETTGGGAHPGDFHRVGPLGVFVPSGRAINPISGDNWEGTGIEPDLAVPAAEALDRALREARSRLEAAAR